MAWTQLIAPTTSAVATKADVGDTSQYVSVVFGADNLATTETATIWGKFPSGNYGALATLTATAGQIAFPGGGSYAVTKAATAGACGVWWSGVVRPG